MHIVVLTHDVDWGFHGPPFEHVLERLDRFDLEDKLAFLARRENIYDGFNVILEAEERVFAKSTFLFRPYYDDGGVVDEYSLVMSELVRSGWEIGLHSNEATSVKNLAVEREVVENSCGCRVVSHRAHYLRINVTMIPKLREVGLLVDSSLCFSRDAPHVDSPGIMMINGVIELPITIMDAYMFSYWGVRGEDEVVNMVKRIVSERIARGERVTTILWHVNAARMAGGKAYPRILEELYSIDDLVFARMSDILGLLEVEKAPRVRGDSNCCD